MRTCVLCNTEYDENEVKYDFGDLLIEKYGYQGDVLQMAIEEVDYDCCAQCNFNMFDDQEWEDENIGPFDDEE